MVPGNKVGHKIIIYSVKKGSARCRALTYDVKFSTINR